MIRVTGTTRMEVELHPEDIRRIAMAAICAAADIMHHECRIEAGQLGIDEGGEFAEIRPVTGLDQSTVDVLKLLKEASIETLQKARIRL